MKRHLFAVVCVLALLVGLQQLPASAAGQPAGDQNPASTVAAPQALLVPTTADGDTVIIAAAGFAPLEAVTFRFGFIDPFTGGITNPVLVASGVADALGRLGDRWGLVPVPPQALPASLAGGLYMLQASGARSGRTAMTVVGLPFLASASGLTCAARPLSPGRFGYAIGDAAASFAPGTEVVGVVDFPARVEAAARVGRDGRFVLIFRVPEGTPGGGYALVVAGLAAGATREELLRSCALTVDAR